VEDWRNRHVDQISELLMKRLANISREDLPVTKKYTKKTIREAGSFS